jgi:hypothetical protein
MPWDQEIITISLTGQGRNRADAVLKLQGKTKICPPGTQADAGQLAKGPEGEVVKMHLRKMRL